MSLPSSQLTPTSTGAALQLRSIEKRYGSARAVADVSLDVRAGEFVTLLGASGSGKTTLLRIVAGFASHDSGQVLLDGQDLSATPVHRRDIGMVFQSYALFPHLSVAQNVAYPLRMRRVPAGERRRRVQEALDAVHLPAMADRRPSQLSGGQQQRVALARAIVSRPRLLLMDEPLGALDRNLREDLQLEVSRLSRELGLTVLNVTHDQEEALTMSDRIAVLQHGRLLQYATPDELYNRPADDDVAAFVGESNIFRGHRGPDGLLSDVAGRVHVPAHSFPGDRVAVVVRPAVVRISRGTSVSSAVSSVPARIRGLAHVAGDVKVVAVASDGRELLVRRRVGEGEDVQVGDDVVLHWAADAGIATRCAD